MNKPDINQVEVDMVPLIDIISLLLMFLIIVGDSAASSNIASLRLPAASEAKSEKDWPGLKTEGRIVIQIKPEYEHEDDQLSKQGKYFVIFNSAKHDPSADAGKSLKDHLTRFIEDALSHNPPLAVRMPDGTLDTPVKLRIPAMCPMTEAEKVLSTIASLQLVNIQYAAVKSERK